MLHNFRIFIFYYNFDIVAKHKAGFDITTSPLTCQFLFQEKLPTSGRGHFTPILKDHLYRCPSRISEEMVRCMASIFCWMCIDSSEMSGKLLSSFFSRSSSSVVLPPRGTTEEQEWPRRSTIEITSIRIDKQCPRASYVISDYRFVLRSQ